MLFSWLKHHRSYFWFIVSPNMKTLKTMKTKIVFPLNDFRNLRNFRTCLDALPVWCAVTAVAVAAPADLPLEEPAVVAAGVCCLWCCRPLGSSAGGAGTPPRDLALQPAQTTNRLNTVRLDWFHVRRPVPYLMQRCGSIVVAETRVDSMLQQQSDHVHVSAVSSTMQRGRPTWSSGRCTSTDPQEKGAHGEVTSTAGVVLWPRDTQD